MFEAHQTGVAVSKQQPAFLPSSPGPMEVSGALQLHPGVLRTLRSAPAGPLAPSFTCPLPLFLPEPVSPSQSHYGPSPEVTGKGLQSSLRCHSVEDTIPPSLPSKGKAPDSQALT